MNVKKEAVDFRNNIKNHGLLFQNNIREDPMLGIGYDAFIRIPCSCSICLWKPSSPFNIRQDKFNQGRHKE